MGAPAVGEAVDEEETPPGLGSVRTPSPGAAGRTGRCPAEQLVS
ncbi:hypothetical protein [Streptomyces olivaceiscleroticus]